MQLSTFRAAAETVHLYPDAASDECDEEFVARANALRPGDELVLHGGVYSQGCVRAISVRGSAERPIVIRAAAGEVATLSRPADNLATQNNIEIVDSAHLVIRGLRFEGGNIGVRFMGGHDIVFEDNEVTGTGVGAVTLNYGNHERIVIRRNHIHRTGLLAGGGVTGEGIYVGCNHGTCAVNDSEFSGNHIHHLRASDDGGNDGIEVKPGSGGNRITDNYIHHTTLGRSYPCVFVYGGGDAPNRVERNVLHDCGEGIQAVADVLVRHNLVFASRISGITVEPHSQSPVVRNVRVEENTFWGLPVCLRFDWREAQDVRVERNVFLCGGALALGGAGGQRGELAGNLAAGAWPAALGGVAAMSAAQDLSAGLPAPLRHREFRALRRLGATQVAALDVNHDGRTDGYDMALIKQRLLAGNANTMQPRGL